MNHLDYSLHRTNLCDRPGVRELSSDVILIRRGGAQFCAARGKTTPGCLKATTTPGFV